MTSYKETLESAAASFIMRRTQDLDIDSADVFRPVDWSQDNDSYFSTLIKAKVLRAADVTRARNDARNRAALAEAFEGSVPATAQEFAQAHARALGVEVDWKGVIRQGRRSILLSDLQRMARIEALTRGLTTSNSAAFSRAAIDDAVEDFYSRAREERPAVFAERFARRQSFPWTEVAEKCFKLDGMTAEFVAAVLKSFIYQTRRKLVNLKVTYHLMPVLHGRQGDGKTWFLEHLLRPIEEATAWSDCAQITDERNMTLFDNLVICLDEMAKAAKADIETIKHVITAETLDRRPMRSNQTVPVPNRATMIGASNHRLDEIIRDETGNRRFVELIYSPPTDRDFIANLDWHAAWASVQPDDADPMAAHRDTLRSLQAEFTTHGPVQDWLENFDADDLAIRRDDGLYTTAELYEVFADYRRRVTPNVDFQARTQSAFASELRRVTDQRPDYRITKRHTRVGNRWHIEGAAARSTVVERLKVVK